MLSEGLLGYVFLLNTDENQDIEYFNYIFDHLYNQFKAPWTVAFVGYNEYKGKLRLPEDRKNIYCEPGKSDSVKNIFLSIMGSGEHK